MAISGLYFFFGNSVNKIWEIRELDGLKFNSLSKIALMDNGDIYVLHSEGGHILKINNDGEKVCEYRNPSIRGAEKMLTTPSGQLYVVGSGYMGSVVIDPNCNKTWDGGFAEDMVIDKDGNIYVVAGNKVWKSGQPKSDVAGTKSIPETMWSITLPTMNSSNHVSLAIDSKDTLYAFTQEGLHVINTDGKEEALFKNIQGRKGVVDLQGNIIVDFNGTVIQKFNSKGEKLWDYNGPPWTHFVTHMVTDSKGNVYATKSETGFCLGSCDHFVHKLDGSNGTLIKKYKPYARGCSGEVQNLAIDAKDDLYVVTCNAITKYKTK